MQFNISVLSVSRETKTSANGKTYVMLEVAYKNLSNGKVEGKKLIPFGENKKTYDTLNDAQSGNEFIVTTEKGEPNQQGQSYWNWTNAEPVAPGTPVAQTTKSTPTATPKSTYETPEERAKKQVYIIKQSSIGAAIELLSIGAKSPPNLQSVLDCAQQLTNWVLTESLATMPNDNLDGEIV